MVSRLTPLPPGPHGLLSGRPDPDLSGYQHDEFVVQGSAMRFSGVMPADGRASLTADDAARFATRVVLRTPVEDFSGTVIVEWLNVSSGADAAPVWTFAAEEVIRRGHAWVGVSAQHVGVQGGRAAVAVGDPTSAGLRAQKRYGELHHPGDAYSYDIFSQAAEVVSEHLDAERVIAVGESQSACALTTYANGVQPLAGIFDAFLIHSRPAAAAPLGEAGCGFNMTEVLGTGPVLIRDDLDVPVMVLVAEGDLFDRIGFLPARQPDAELFRLWEVAGAAHADQHVIGLAEPMLGCEVPVNRGQQYAVVRAAMRALEVWVRDGVAPPAAERIEVQGDDVVRDSHGIAVGGVRTPTVDAPTECNSGRAWPGANVACQLFGSATPLASPAFADVAAYLAAYGAATDAAITAGFVLAEDRDAVAAQARPDLVEPLSIVPLS